MWGIQNIAFAIVIAISGQVFARSQGLPGGSSGSDNPMNPGYSSGGSAGSDTGSFSGIFSGGSLQGRLASAASSGIGKTAASPTTPFCYRAVKRIIAYGLGKDEGCVRGILNGGAAVNALSDLQRAGFRDDRSQCKSSGVIRVYRGQRIAGTRSTLGDRAGHIEIMGDDGNFHSFYSTSEPIDETMRGRRILAGCFVPDENAIQQGPVGRCGQWKGASRFGGSRKSSGKARRR